MGIGKSIFLLFVFLSYMPVFAQVNTAWVRHYNGPDNYNDGGWALAVDDGGNVYVTGISEGSGTAKDWATIKYASNGDVLWVKRYDGPGNFWDIAFALAVDGGGNVCVAGHNTGTSMGDYATIKYAPNGDVLWVRTYDGPGGGMDIAYALVVDDSGNVYVTGASDGSGGNSDYATIKYASNGDVLWVKRYNGLGNGYDYACALAVDDSGNVYVTGGSDGGGGNSDYATIKYASNGDVVWVKRYNGLGDGNDQPGDFLILPSHVLAVDGDANVYVTGRSDGGGGNSDYATIKYASNGDVVWVKRYNGPGNSADGASALAVDDSGNVNVTGLSIGTGGNLDYATIKYRPNGDTAWIRRYNGQGNDNDEPNALALDKGGNVYVTGFGSGDYATIKYAPNGDVVWVKRYNGLGNSADGARALAVDTSGNVYVTGGSWGSGTSSDYATIKYVQDTDGDGLPDNWETNGYDYDENGTVDLNLPAMGANPLHKDIFVEIDWIAADTGETQSHKPCVAAIDSVIAAFDRAPVENPDSISGIKLHVDYGQWDSLSEGNEVPYSDLNPWEQKFQNIKNVHFKPARHHIFHYCIFGDSYDGGSSSGVSRNSDDDFFNGASDFLITCPVLTCDNLPEVTAQAGTFMHELGHNLGLGHGGEDHLNFKPNYLSVMNYSFQKSGLRYRGADGLLDYSRFSAEDLLDLHEDNLDETVGLNGGSKLDGYGSRFYPFVENCSYESNRYCFDPQRDPKFFEDIFDMHGPIDWNQNGGDPEMAVSANINAGYCIKNVNVCGWSIDTLRSSDDWGRLVFTGGSIGAAGIPAESLPMDIQWDTLEMRIEDFQLFCVAKPGDANADNQLTLADIIATVNHIFGKSGCGSLPFCWLSGSVCRGDWNGSNTVSLVDVIRGVNYIFNKPGGPWNAVPVGVCCLPVP